MVNEYLIQLGLIILPIAVAQMVDVSPSRTWRILRQILIGLYGGAAAILCQMMPVHILGQAESFECVPIILSILYGKRKSGTLAIFMLVAYKVITGDSADHVLANILAILVYSTVPMLLAERFDHAPRRTRLLFAGGVTVVTLVVELLFLFFYFVFVYGDQGIKLYSGYSGFLAIACSVQLGLMVLAFLLLETQVETRRTRLRYQSLIDNNPIGVGAFNEHNECIAANAAFQAITGYSEAELMGKTVRDLRFAEDHQDSRLLLMGIQQGNVQRDLEIRLKRKGGQAIEARCTFVPMVEDDRTIGYFSMLTDISEEKATEALLRESEKLSAVGQLAAGVAHEVRNPLTSVKGFVQLLSEKANGTDKEYLGVVKDELNRIEEIVSGLLVMAKPQVSSYRTVNLRDRVMEVVSLVTGAANLGGVKIHVEDDGAPLTVMGDSHQLKQVVLNLSQNAIESMPNGGRLDITLEQLDGIAVLIFSDTGSGMEPQVLEQVGRPFFTTKDGGTGLGLTATKRIVQNHGGYMEIKSAPGEGTTVTVVFPSMAAGGQNEAYHKAYDKASTQSTNACDEAAAAGEDRDDSVE